MNFQRFRRSVIGCFIVALCSCHLLGTPDAHYYVSPDGWDFARGTENSPWQSIGEAANRAQPGDTIHILPGTYNELLLVDVSGEPGNPITFLGHEGAVIDGEGLEYSSGGDHVPAIIYLPDNDHLVFDGLELVNGQEGVLVVDSEDIVIRNLTISEIDESGISVDLSTDIVVESNTLSNMGKAQAGGSIEVSDTDGFEITGNSISDIGLFSATVDWNYASDGIVSGLGSKNGLISGNTIDDVGGYGIALESWLGGRSIEDITIQENQISVCTRGIGVTCTAFDGNTPTFGGIAIRGNTIGSIVEHAILVTIGGDTDRPVNGIEISGNTITEQATGIELSAGNSSLGNVEISNNLVINSSEAGVLVAFSSATVNGRFVNNTIVNDTEHESAGLTEISGVEPDSGTQNFTVANNLFTGTATHSLVTMYRDAEWVVTTAPWVLTHNLFTEFVGAFGETHGTSPVVVSDAGFANPGGGDYSLSATSPARDAGNSDHAPGVDITDTSRPQGSEVDIGAFEYVP